MKAAAFLPAECCLQTSVSMIRGLCDGRVWKIGRRIQGKRTLHGRADIVVAKIVERNGLRVELDNLPWRHASIVGWPDDKEHRKSIAQELARDATPHLLDNDKPE